VIINSQRRRECVTRPTTHHSDGSTTGAAVSVNVDQQEHDRQQARALPAEVFAAGVHAADASSFH